MKLLVDMSTLLKIRQARVVGWFPMTLVVIGSLAMVAGIFMSVFSMTVLALNQRSLELPPHGAVYVGANTCYTCHTDGYSDWSLTLTVQSAVNPAAKPKLVVSDLGSREEVRQVNVDEIADACTAGKIVAPAGIAYPRQYVIKTEQGYSVLPVRWNTADSEVLIPDATALRSEACRTVGSLWKNLSVESLALSPISDISWVRLGSTQANAPGRTLSDTLNTS